MSFILKSNVLKKNNIQIKLNFMRIFDELYLTAKRVFDEVFSLIININDSTFETLLIYLMYVLQLTSQLNFCNM